MPRYPAGARTEVNLVPTARFADDRHGRAFVQTADAPVARARARSDVEPDAARARYPALRRRRRRSRRACSRRTRRCRGGRRRFARAHIVLIHVVLRHELDELIRIFGIGRIAGFVNFARELVGIVAVIERIFIAIFLQKRSVILNRLEPRIVGAERPGNRDVFAIFVFLRRARNRTGRSGSLDAEQVFGLPDGAFAPSGFERGLRERYRCRHARRPVVFAGDGTEKRQKVVGRQLAAGIRSEFRKRRIVFGLFGRSLLRSVGFGRFGFCRFGFGRFGFGCALHRQIAHVHPADDIAQKRAIAADFRDGIRIIFNPSGDRLPGGVI